MTDLTIHRTRATVPLAPPLEGRPLGGRLGLDVPRETWPTAPELKRLEACGYGWIQMHAPPVAMLADPVSVRRHGDCLRAVLAPTSLHVAIHAPEELCVGEPAHDAAFVGLIDHAVAVGAAFIVYHAAYLPVAEGATADRVEDRLLAEERALCRFAARAEQEGLMIALENGAPAFPSPPVAPLLSHSPLFVRDLVRRIGSPALGMTFDLGHAHIAGQLAGIALVDALAAVRNEIVLFHVHDNLGLRRGPGTPPGIVPLRLDLHMAPGRGTLPWRAIAPLVRTHPAPLLMEVVAAQRPDPLLLATVSAELLTPARQRCVGGDGRIVRVVLGEIVVDESAGDPPEFQQVVASGL
ncbi:MAG TPA: sugar phosphate isomerase/epimerase, partial [Conexibacter sp.]|nr:sugar phosphate isomerase/epimerase [Conexibacter sp.]